MKPYSNADKHSKCIIEVGTNIVKHNTYYRITLIKIVNSEITERASIVVSYGRPQQRNKIHGNRTMTLHTSFLDKSLTFYVFTDNLTTSLKLSSRLV